MRDLVKELVEIPGPAGSEQQIRDLIAGKLRGVGDELRVDTLGSLVLRNGSRQKEGGLRVLVVAHMDEPGVMVSHIDDRGFARFTPLGMARPYTWHGCGVRFANGTAGVIGVEQPDRSEKHAPIEAMFIDLGMTNRDECPVKVGDVAALDRPVQLLGDHLVGKAMGSRSGIAILIEAIRQMEATPHEVHFVFSVQSEVGGQGAVTAAYAVDPDLALVVDATGAGDTPGANPAGSHLGKGPVLKVRDRTRLINPSIINWMAAHAERLGVPYQMEALEAGGQEAQRIQEVRAGVPLGLLCYPCRYLGTPAETVSNSDLKHTTRLLVELLSRSIEVA